MSNDAQSQSDAIKPKRCWLQFRLRTLLGLVAVLAVVLALVVVPAERQKRAVAAVKNFGGGVMYDDETDSIADCSFGYCSSPQRAWYRTLLGDDYFSSVAKVFLGNTQVSDAGLEHLKGLSRLEFLSLCGTQVTDAGLVRPRGLKQLKSLDLEGAHVTAAGVAELRKALPKCRIDGP